MTTKRKPPELHKKSGKPISPEATNLLNRILARLMPKDGPSVNMAIKMELRKPGEELPLQDEGRGTRAMWDRSIKRARRNTWEGPPPDIHSHDDSEIPHSWHERAKTFMRRLVDGK